MSDILAQFGVGGDDLASHAEDVSYPKPVQGRVAHIDADFISYQVSAPTAAERDGLEPPKSFEDMKHNAREAALHLMRKAAATEFVCHVTPNGSTKGGRHDQAIQQEYQGNRKDKEKPEFLDAIRKFIGQELNGVPHLNQEADDGMAQANYNAQGPGGKWGNSNLSVIVSMDKDLRMVPGLHYDFDTDSVFCVGDPFGSIYLDETGSTKKIKGWGTKFFWAQCLMGDAADNIRGLPTMAGAEYLEVAPTAAYKKLCDKLHDEKSDSTAVLAKIRKEQSKTKKVGPVLTYEFLEGCRNDRECYQAIKSAWISAQDNGGHEYTNYRDGSTVSPTRALLGDMQTLWMRRNDNPNDVIDWIKEACA